MTQFDAADVRRYYDRHTSTFVRLGQGGGSIHRAVWGAGVENRRQAFHFVDDRIADLARTLPANPGLLHLVDLGCGVAGSLCYLARRLPMRGTGVTLSPVQIRMATERIRDAGLADRVRCVEADFCRIPESVEPADLAYAIESFVHGPAAAVMLDAWARLVRPGGVLVICDDFRRAAGDEAAVQAIDRFRRGWHVNTLLTRDELQACAHAAGFDHESTIDLTASLETGRLRDRLIAGLTTLAGWLAPRTTRIDSLRGGSALQECLARGWIGYDFSVFRRRG